MAFAKFAISSMLSSAPLASVTMCSYLLRQRTTIMSVVELHFIITDHLLAREAEELPLNALLHQRTCC